MMTQSRSRNKSIRILESYLLNYRTYKVGIDNLQKKLDFIMPGITATYEVREHSVGSFIFSAETEGSVMDRIESKHALDLYEEMSKIQVIVDAIDKALGGLEELERTFIKLRYFKGKSIEQISMVFGYSERSIYNIRTQAMDKLLISLSSILCDSDYIYN